MSDLVPENGTRVLCRLHDYDHYEHWFERKVLGNTEGSSDYPSGMILVDSAAESHSIIATGSFVRVDSEEGQRIIDNEGYIPLQ